MISSFTRVGRPGAFGSRKQEIERNYDNLYGQSNWEIVWDIGRSIDLPSALVLYEESYFNYFQQHPEELRWIANNFSNVYDNNPSNVHSELDYTIQEFGGNHFQDIAIRNCLVRNNLWFTGKELLEVRMAKQGVKWNPGKIPFFLPGLIPQPEIPGWWNPGSVESWYQSAKYLETKNIPFDPTADLYFATTNEGKVKSAQLSLGNKFLIIQIKNLAISEEQQSTQQIADHKARVSYAVLCKSVIVDDSGFVIPSQNGYPGIHVGRELKDQSKGLEHFLQIARNDPRGYVEAYWDMTVGYFDDTIKKPRLFTSKIGGRLIGEARGEKKEFIKSDLAYAFIVDGFSKNKTIAEMNEEEYKQYATTDRWRELAQFLEERKV